MDFLREISERHESLKKRIHNFRIPLSPFYRRIATAVYISIPVVAGYFIMQVAIGQSMKNLGMQGEKLEERNRVLGNPGADRGTADQKKALQMLLDRHKLVKNSDGNN